MPFALVRGQERPAAVLGRFLKKGRIPAAVIFYGPEGTGKTLMAVEFAKALLCRERPMAPRGGCGSCQDCVNADKRLHPDLTLVDARYQASLREEEPSKQKTLRVDTLRHLRKGMELGSMMGSWKVAIVAAAHTMELSGANSLLKIIEEPPPKTLWVLVTSRLGHLPATVRSRAFQVPFGPLTPAIIRDILADRGVEERQAAALSELCDGSASRALELWEAGLPAPVLDPFAAAESLPRELYLARSRVELSIFCLEQSVRLRIRRGELGFAQAAHAVRGLASLKRQLQANADPATILTLAYLEVERL